MRCPFPFAIGIAGWRVFSQFRYACKRGCCWAIREPGLVAPGVRRDFCTVLENAGLFHGQVINAGFVCHRIHVADALRCSHGDSPATPKRREVVSPCFREREARTPRHSEAATVFAEV